MLSKKKKIIILVVMLLLLVGTGYLNIVLNTDTQETGTVTTGNFFTTYRADRETVRDQKILYYDAIIASADSSAEAKTSAETEKAKMISLMETELVTEGLLKSRGFEDAIITFNNSNVNVLIKTATQLTNIQVAQIVDVIQQQIEVDIANITVVQVA